MLDAFEKMAGLWYIGSIISDWCPTVDTLLLTRLDDDDDDAMVDLL
jgi:hypothetical protein